MAAEGASLVSSAAPPTKRGFLRHFETALLHSTSAALTAEKEKVVDTLTAAGESGLSNAHGVFLAQHCAHATREECAFVDGRLRLWFAAGTGGDFKELFDTLEEHGKLTLSEALARCAQPPSPPAMTSRVPHPAPPMAHTRSTSTAGRSAPPTSRLARIGAKSLCLLGS